MFLNEIFGQRLAEIRQKQGETQDELGEILGIRKSQISQMENGLVATTLVRLVKICEHYHVSSDYLLGFTDDPAPQSWKEN